VELDAVTVEFDLVNPLVSLGRLGLQGGELGFNEPRHLNTLWQQLNSQKTGLTGKRASLRTSQESRTISGRCPFGHQPMLRFISAPRPDAPTCKA
jgi:hypothetical protein